MNCGIGGTGCPPLELMESRSDMPGGIDEPPDAGAIAAYELPKGGPSKEKMCGNA